MKKTISHPAMAYAGTFFVITLFAPITAPFPVLTPDMFVAPYPVQTSCPIWTSPFALGCPSIRAALIKGYVVNQSVRCSPPRQTSLRLQ